MTAGPDRVTVTPGSTPPWSSVTLPTSSPNIWPVCAAAGASANASTMARAARARRIARVTGDLLFRARCVSVIANDTLLLSRGCPEKLSDRAGFGAGIRGFGLCRRASTCATIPANVSWRRCAVKRLFALCGFALALALGPVHAQAPPPQRSARPVPAPAQIIGFAPGTERKLADFSQVSRYFKALAAASPRVRLFTIGKSTDGREMILAAISSEENLRRLDRYRDIARQLADSRGLTDQQAHQLAREGRAIVWIDFGLHATEVGHAQVSSEVAHMVATSESPEMKRIRDEVIFVTVPGMNPDGLDVLANWDRAQLGTPFEGTTPPVLNQKYAGHDNNRDWFMQNLDETRVVTRQLYQEGFPKILYNQHQSGLTSPRIWTPPMDDPVNPNMHPLINRGIPMLGVGIQQRLEQEGKPGAQGFSQYSNWWNGGMRSTPCFHNIVGILTEVAGGRLATPVDISVDQLPRTLASGESAREPSTWNPSPW